MRDFLLNIAKDKAAQRIATVAKMTPAGRLIGLYDRIPVLYSAIKWAILSGYLVSLSAFFFSLGFILSKMIGSLLSFSPAIAEILGAHMNDVIIVTSIVMILPWLIKALAKWLSFYRWFDRQEQSVSDKLKSSADSATILAKNALGKMTATLSD